MILNYLAEGGQVIYNMAGELVDLPNFNALCAAYGMQVADGMIADTSQGYQNNPLSVLRAGGHLCGCGQQPHK